MPLIRAPYSYSSRRSEHSSGVAPTVHTRLKPHHGNSSPGSPGGASLCPRVTVQWVRADGALPPGQASPSASPEGSPDGAPWQEEVAARRLAAARKAARLAALEEGKGWMSVRGQNTDLLRYRAGRVEGLGAAALLWAAPRRASTSPVQMEPEE